MRCEIFFKIYGSVEIEAPDHEVAEELVANNVTDFFYPIEKILSSHDIKYDIYDIETEAG